MTPAHVLPADEVPARPGLASTRPIGVGLLGLGTVGAGVARALTEKRDTLARRVGRPFEIHGVLVRNLNKPRAFQPRAALVLDPEAVLSNPNVDVIVEVLGGEEPARSYI